VWRQEAPHVLAALLRRYGDLGDCEDAAQDAAMVHGPDTGLALLAPLVADPAMRRHHRLHAVRAHLRELAGDRDGAAEDYRRAARLTASLPEQRYLNRRLAALAG
jgi:predicted RNA polymerase sigma factor